MQQSMKKKGGVVVVGGSCRERGMFCRYPKCCISHLPLLTSGGLAWRALKAMKGVLTEGGALPALH